MSFTYSPKIVTDGLVFYVDGANPNSIISGETIWNDLIQSNNGILTNGPTFDPSGGGSIIFDGSDDYVNYSDNDIFSFGNGTSDSPFTISTWVNWLSLGGGGANFKGIIGKDNGTQREWALLDANNGKMRIFIKNLGGGSQQSIDSTTTLSTQLWYNIVATYSGVGGNNAADGLSLYLNSVVETPTNIIKGSYVAMSNTSAPLTIGKYSSNEFPGKISNIQIYNRVLSSDEVLRNYNALKGRFGL